MTLPFFRRQPLRLMLKQTAGLLFASSFLCTSAQAVEVKDLGKAMIPVESRAIAEQKTALSRALADVIIKNSGTPAALDHPLINQQLNNPQQFLIQFGYQESANNLYLTSQFDTNKIQQLLNQAQLPIWSNQRPLVLFWLVNYNQQGQAQIIGDQSQDLTKLQLELDAQNYGLPMLFPVMDLDDSMRVNIADVRGNFPEQVALASQRYQADYFVLAEVQPLANGQTRYVQNLYAANGNMQNTRPLQQLTAVLPTVTETSNSMVTGLTQYFVNQYAVTQNPSQSTSVLTVQFNGIHGLEQLNALEQYLKQLNIAQNSHIAQIQGDQVRYQFHTSKPAAAVARQLNLGARLSQQQEPVVDPQVQLYYNWR